MLKEDRKRSLKYSIPYRQCSCSTTF